MLSPRQAGLGLALLVTVLVALLLASVFLPELAAWRTAMVWFGGSVGVASLALFAVLVRSLGATARGAEAEEDFEALVMREVASAEAAPSSPRGDPSPVPVPMPPGPAPQKTALGQTPVESLLAQLRLARVEALPEGELREGPLAGTMLLRLGCDQTAAVLPRAPGPGEWSLLFPRFDRVFIPAANGKWTCAERLESFVHARLDVTL